MDLYIPSPGPHHSVDFVIYVHFGIKSCQRSDEECPLLAERPLLIHAMATTDDTRKEFVLVTQKTHKIQLLETRAYFVVPEDAHVIPPDELISYFVKFYHPFVLGQKTRLGTNSRTTFSYLRRTFGLQNMVLMDVGDTPYLSSSLRLLLLYCQVRKDRELHAMKETQQKKVLQQRQQQRRAVLENGHKSAIVRPQVYPSGNNNKIAAALINNNINVDWKNARANHAVSTGGGGADTAQDSNDSVAPANPC